MERKVIFRDRQEVTPDDLNNPQEFVQASIDHVVVDGIEAGRRFTGFVVTQASATSVSVAAGRLFYDGRVHFRSEPDGVAIDLLALKPELQSKVVAIVTYPETIQTGETTRAFEVDADAEDFVTEPVDMEIARRARLEAVGGAEAVSPQPPVIDNTAVIVALVTMGPAGILSIARNEAKLLRNLSRVADDVVGLLEFQDEAGPQLGTLKSDFARLANDLANNGNKELLLQVAGDTASLKARLDIPDVFVGFRAHHFLDDSTSDPAYAGYAARIVEGLRFPFAATATQELALLNPNQPTAKVSAGSLLLPAYTKVERRITKGDNGVLTLSDYSNLDNRTLVRLSMSPSRVRFGPDFEVTAGSAFWNSGTYLGRLNDGIRAVFQKDGETFQVYETGKVDQDGHKILRLAKFWTDDVTAPYWSRKVTEEVKLGYAHVETFLNTQDRWVVGLGPHMKGKPAAGTITFGCCETYRGKPDMSRIIAMTTVNAADLVLVGGAGGFPEIPVEPFFQEGGKRYGYFAVTQYGFQIAVADGQGAETAGFTGTYYYGLNGGDWFAEPGKHMVWRDFSAVFPNAKVDVDLEALQLGGGIQVIDVLADSVIPGSTELFYSVQIGGVWRALDASDPDILAAGNGLLPFRVTFLGTPDIMPGLRLDGSQVQLARLALSAKWASDTKTIAASDEIVETFRLRGFDDAHATFTPKLDRGPGTVETADTVVTTTLPDGTVQKVCTFNLAAATTDYKIVAEMTADAASRTFTVAEATEVAL